MAKWQIKRIGRFSPFSHTPGVEVLLPHMGWTATCYPTRVSFTSYLGRTPEPIQTVEIPLIGPPKNFTVIQDLDKGEVKIFGQFQQGYHEWVIRGDDARQCVSLCTKRGAVDRSCLVTKEGIFPYQPLPREEKKNPRLLCGVHKKQEWESVSRRLLLAEILPFWYQMGITLPTLPKWDGPFSSLGQLGRSEIGDALLALFQAHFSGMGVPHLEDIFLLGLPSLQGDCSPLSLLKEGSRFIEHLLIQSDGKRIQILPHPPTELHAGRFVGVSIDRVGVFHLEWSKKRLRRVWIEATHSTEIALSYPKHITQFRLSVGDKVQTMKTRESLPVKPGKTYQLDRFL